MLQFHPGAETSHEEGPHPEDVGLGDNGPELLVPSSSKSAETVPMVVDPQPAPGPSIEAAIRSHVKTEVLTTSVPSTARSMAGPRSKRLSSLKSRKIQVRTLPPSLSLGPRQGGQLPYTY